MSEASDCNPIVMASTFSVLRIYFRGVNTAQFHVKLPFKWPVDITDFVFRRPLVYYSTYHERGSISAIIEMILDTAQTTIEKYKPPFMSTKHCHSLEHLAHDRQDVGAAQYLHYSLYEQFHKHFKERYSAVQLDHCTAPYWHQIELTYFYFKLVHIKEARHITWIRVHTCCTGWSVSAPCCNKYAKLAFSSYRHIFGKALLVNHSRCHGRIGFCSSYSLRLTNSSYIHDKAESLCRFPH